MSQMYLIRVLITQILQHVHAKKHLLISALFILASIHTWAQGPEITPTNPPALTAGSVIKLSTARGGNRYLWLYNNTDEIVPKQGLEYEIEVRQPGFYKVIVDDVSSQEVFVSRTQTQIATTNNYSKSERILKKGAKNELQLEELDSKDIQQTIQYSDGLGRALQSINVAGSPSGQDIIQPFAYDAMGLQPKQYLPYTGNNSGEYTNTWLANQRTFYLNSPKVSRTLDTSGDFAYSEVEVEDSPLQRPVEVTAPGNTWKKIAGHTKRFEQRSNTSADNVYIWAYTSAGLGTVGSVAPVQAAVGSLMVSEYIDEDNKHTVTFSNSRGQVICQRVIVVAEALETNYAYDISGNLHLVIPPQASKLAQNQAQASAFLTIWVFVYEYDKFGRQIGSKVPGKGWSYAVYDRWDRLVATQNANQRVGQAIRWRWMYIKYDELNRPIIIGEYNNTATQAQLSAAVLSTSNTETRFETRINNEIGYSLTGTFPKNTATTTVLTVKYYDDYNYFPLLDGQRGGRSSLAFFPELNNSLRNIQVKGLRTGGRNRVLGTLEWLSYVQFYDDYGRIIQIQQDNHQQKTDRTTYQFDFTKLISSLHSHSRQVSSSVIEQHTILTEYKYDTQGRTTEIWQSIDGSLGGSLARTKVASLEYNELGQLVDKKLGYDSESGNYLQSVDYRYNIRGWLNNINDRSLSGRYRDPSTGNILGQDQPELNSDDPNNDEDADQDLFGLELKYEATVAPNYNGNISEAIWNSRTPNKGAMRHYAYAYDQANRITEASYGAMSYTNGIYGWENEKDDANAEGRFTLSGITYDNNGNIKSLNRNGNTTINTSSGNPVPQYGKIDQLTFDHTGNQLIASRDAIGATNAPNDFEDGGNGTSEYTYDPNGNLTSDSNKGITITYNTLDLPARITFANGNYIENTYTATGEKIRSIVNGTVNNQPFTRDINYISGFVYGQGTNTFVHTPVGRALYEPSRVSSDKWVHEYHLRDHLGSLRLAIRKGGTTLQSRATMEPSHAMQEEQDFDNLAETRQLDAAHAYSGLSSARLNAGQLNRAKGPTTTMKVSAGDTIAVEVFGMYNVGRRGRVGITLLPLGMTNPTATVPTKELNYKPRRLLPSVALGISIAWATVTHGFNKHQGQIPKASLVYELYNKDSSLVASENIYLDEIAREGWQKMQGGIRADNDGFVKVYLQNASAQDAWFDDLALRVTPDMIVQENHYDAFGQNLVDIETFGTPDAKQQFTGQEKLDELAGLNLLDYNSRLYDFQLGRFISVDGAASNYFDQGPYNYCFNSPVTHVDPDGRNPFVAAFVIGGIFNVYLQHKQGNLGTGWEGWKNGAAAFVIGGAAGVVGMATGGAIAPLVGGGILGGAAAGAVGGYAGGFYAGYTNEAYFGSKTFVGSLKAGLKAGIPGAIGGGIIGGIMGGLGAAADGKDVLTGSTKGTVTSEPALPNVNDPNATVNYKLSEEEFKKLTADLGDKTLYRGMTGNETKPGNDVLFVTESAEYAETYVLNGGKVMELRVPINTWNSYVQSGYIEPFKGINSSAVGNMAPAQEWKIVNPMVKQAFLGAMMPHKP